MLRLSKRLFAKTAFLVLLDLFLFFWDKKEG